MQPYVPAESVSPAFEPAHRTAPKPSAKPEQTKKTSSSKDPRGGAGRKQGRKKVLVFEEMILVGATCESDGVSSWSEKLWRNIATSRTSKTLKTSVRDIR